MTAIAYLPTDPESYNPPIGLIGAGNIAGTHLAAYRDAGYNVTVICDTVLDRAHSRRDEYFPGARITADYHEVLATPEIEVVDIATHVETRPELVRAALLAGKHVLSQKPFVLDLDEGERLADLADREARLLAVNQNGRWAPHHSFLLGAVGSGLLGRLSSGDFALYWAHDEAVADHPVFSTLEDLILYDFGIHWFDLIARVFCPAGQATSVYATLGRTADQVIPVPTSAQVVVTFPEASATLLLRGSAHRAAFGGYRVDGSKAVVTSASADELGGTDPQVRVHDQEGENVVNLKGNWWTNGMHGAMGELLAAIEAGRQPSNSARSALPGLALCFAAMEAARTGAPVDPRGVRRPPR
ncbi:MAG: Gfo/Idh/MocA family oxidoreductase [Bifidobacteriaceae bacterium]|jgi:predicted dehydrogenase|nr:Gfo/Idh/MocA family oxidoreductase [Bifidobacteriaceae bacterium]